VDGKPFAGFPNSGEPTIIPSLFFSRVLPEITDPAELVVTAYVFFAATLHPRRRPRYVTRGELAADGGLARTLANLVTGDDALERGLALAVERATLVSATSCPLPRTGEGPGVRDSNAASDADRLYAVNTPVNRRALEALAAEGVRLDEPLPPATAETVESIFSLYEENVGSITPLIADELNEAEGQYPNEWILAAFREAAVLNKRNWRYIRRILERWETEGRDHEKRERDPQIEWLEQRYREGLERRTRTGP
jgi:DnaD/phage-associated family protein